MNVFMLECELLCCGDIYKIGFKVQENDIMQFTEKHKRITLINSVLIDIKIAESLKISTIQYMEILLSLGINIKQYYVNIYSNDMFSSSIRTYYSRIYSNKFPFLYAETLRDAERWKEWVDCSRLLIELNK